MNPTTEPRFQNRRNIYYWKCDRDHAFQHGPHFDTKATNAVAEQLLPVLRHRLNEGKLTLQAHGGSSSHLTYLAGASYGTLFIRVQNCPELDDYMDVEAHVHQVVRDAGASTPLVHFVDSSRKELPFAYQVMEHLPYTDLNTLLKERQLSILPIAEQIGRSVANWQQVPTQGFGPFDPTEFRDRHALVGLHDTYGAYFRLNLDKHLKFLVDADFLSGRDADLINRLIEEHSNTLNIEHGCLVHKDLALWNILGTPNRICAFIDWEDTIAGDPLDDLSLLACFHSGDVIKAAIAGYQKVRPLPGDYLPRFWLHLLRNMIVKATIRVGAGYFERDQSFFLFSSGGNGNSLKSFTRVRLQHAYRGLRDHLELDTL